MICQVGLEIIIKNWNMPYKLGWITCNNQMIKQYNLCHTLLYDYWTIKYYLEKSS
jgi:hypothetical protein